MSQRTQGQTMVTTRDNYTTHLASEVASVVPRDELIRARRGAASSLRQRKTTRVLTTFCPVCGGHKQRTAVRCRACYVEAREARRAKAVAAVGEQRVRTTKGWQRGARANLSEDLVRAGKPDAGGYGWTGAMRRHVGSGTVREQPRLRRMIKTEAGWVEAVDDQNEETSDGE